MPFFYNLILKLVVLSTGLRLHYTNGFSHPDRIISVYYSLDHIFFRLIQNDKPPNYYQTLFHKIPENSVSYCKMKVSKLHRRAQSSLDSSSGGVTRGGAWNYVSSRKVELFKHCHTASLALIRKVIKVVLDQTITDTRGKQGLAFRLFCLMLKLSLWKCEYGVLKWLQCAFLCLAVTLVLPETLHAAEWRRLRFVRTRKDCNPKTSLEGSIIITVQ